MATSNALFAPLPLGGGAGPISLAHRIVLAPLTRNRAAEPSLAPHASAVDYYSQRASPGGLLITEATNISPEAMAYMSVPGIWTDEQVAGWRLVTEGVHAKGGKVVCQLWHTGRVAVPSYGQHPLLRRSDHVARRGLAPGVSSSASAMLHPRSGKPLGTVSYEGAESYDEAGPRPLGADEIPRLLEDYAHAGRNALRAGFDGVELHAAHGYLIDQFLNNGVNTRTDEYGGSVENRCRLLFAAVKTLVGVMGEGRVGVRLSPTTIDPRTGRQNQLYYAATTDDPDEIYAHAVKGLNAFPLAYLLLSEPRWTGRSDGDHGTDKGFSQPLTNNKYRAMYDGTLMAAGGFTPTTAQAAIEEGHYDLIAFGRWFISNPDLPARIRSGVDLNVYDRSTFYTATMEGGGAEGYTDYPTMAEARAAEERGEEAMYKTVPQSQIGTSLAASKL